METHVQKSPEVLIVGAGPSGLMMACQLAIYNIPFRIIDKSENHTTQSRALVIQARSIEILDQMGIAGKALQQGKITNAIGAFFNGRKVLRVKVSNMGAGLTKFPYLLMLEQSCTEKILVDFLNERGHQVGRQTELKSLRQEENKVVCILKSVNRSEETIEAKYVVGADGAHSIVREELNIPFVGSTYPESLFVLDCKAEVDIPSDEMYLTFSDIALGGFFPLTNGRWRILGNIPKELEGKEEIKFEDIERNFAARVKLNVRLYDPQWVSVYRSHHRYASTFRQNRCFLIGDAAHIHSPVGAQGMNTGLQDAYNLAWKLALVVNNQGNDNLLNTYTAERITIAKNLVGSTDRVFNLVTSANAVLKTFRLYIIPIVLRLAGPIFEKLSFIQRFAFKGISEIGISYRNGPLTQEASLGSFPSATPKPGDRLPFIPYYNEKNEETNIQDKVKGKFFTLLVFGVRPSQEIAVILNAFKDLFSVETISLSEQTKALYKELGIKQDGCFLIRPDMYIAYRADGLDPDHLKKYLEQFLNFKG